MKPAALRWKEASALTWPAARITPFVITVKANYEFNDSAMAALAMQAEGRIRRIVILDCDVHQGNGTASILADDPTVFTFSIHGARNFPFPKESSDLDIELPDGTGDAGHMDALERGICHALSAARPELAIYVAGADPYREDRLGAARAVEARPACAG